MNLVILVLVLSIAAWAAAHRLRKNSAGRDELHVLARAGLSQKAGLAVVSVFGTRLLIGYGDGSPNLLMDLTKSRSDSVPDMQPGAEISPLRTATGSNRNSPAGIFSRLLAAASQAPPGSSPAADDGDESIEGAAGIVPEPDILTKSIAHHQRSF